MTAKVNEKFICIVPQSGYRLAMFEPMATERLLALDVPDDRLGEAIQDALAESRFLSLEEANALRLTADSHYAEWVHSLMERYEYGSKQALFKKMKSCSIVISDEEMVLSPSHHDRLDGWSRTRGDGIEDVIIPSDSSLIQIGAALRVAFMRCTG
ncbi:contact-dependent growth inhibition system immunity protein [Cupriavidus sp. CV2]|uniref:contact-dependent growth inhibition system immunity protein n=1 Tax=Cupriavidus ulmosensis TaxID=3065913 RepID=UPI00296B1B58|nr:contact-dependent growth inhibition system immunity protein [Cupriavidus sp. CV2]MDW3684259.1 contact-dependent growth inhibition system immunity protein [Cupriavidus sp. CV2]